MAISPDGKWVASWETHEGVQVRDAETGNEVTLLRPQSRSPLFGEAAVVAFTPDGQRLVTSGANTRRLKVLQWWKTGDWSRSKQWENDLRDIDSFQASFSANGKTVAIIDFFSVRIWDTASERTQWACNVNVNNWVATVALAPSGQVLAFAAGPELKIVDVQSKAVVTKLKSSTKHVQQCVFSPDGRYLATVSNDTTVVFWDTTTWKEARRYSWNIGELKCLAFSHDGAIAAAGSGRGKIVIWDVD